MKKKIIALLMTVTVAGALFAGCGAAPQEQKEEAVSEAAEEAEEATSEATEEAVSEAAEEATSEATEEAASEAAEESGEVGIANPWSEAASAEEAAQGAGLDGLSLVENLDLDLGEEFSRTYRYMDGIAEITLEYPASQITIRKGTPDQGEDISGDYNTYSLEWAQNIKGLEVHCFGNREDTSAKTIWALEDASYSITALGLGGDEDFGLSADRLNSVINGLQ